MRVTVEPIGYVTSSRTVAADDGWDAEFSAIQLLETYGPEALDGLMDFSHVEVLFHFHMADGAHVVTGARHPRENAAWPLTGIFAQRGRNRPNLLGSTICRLAGVAGTTLQVSGLDAIDGTPVLDIKPVMREFLPRGALRQPQWSHELMKDYWGEAQRT
jgi:tRNA (adenine37-N6)-methyltransferase